MEEDTEMASDPRAPSYLNSKLLGYATIIRYKTLNPKPRTLYCGDWSPRKNQVPGQVDL